MLFCRAIAISLAAAVMAAAAPLVGAMLTLTSSGSSRLEISGPGYQFSAGLESYLMGCFHCAIGSSSRFDELLVSMYSGSGTINGVHYPNLSMNGTYAAPSAMILETDEVTFTRATRYQVPFRLSGSIAAYRPFEAESPDPECVLCVGAGGTGIGTLETYFLESEGVQEPYRLTMRWGDFAAVPEPGSFLLVAAGALAVVCRRLNARNARNG